MPNRTRPPRPTAVTTVFRSGNSDAVRLPRAFRMTGRRVRLTADGPGRVIVEAVTAAPWPDDFTGWLASGPWRAERIRFRREAARPANEVRPGTRLDD
jgi:virulence-associated protein VagC